MARFKDVEWNLPVKPEGNIDSWDALHGALLMDIRDELKRLNGLLHCSNFTGIPHTLLRISRNTAKPRKKKR